jgi:hypothetical protein
MTRKAKLWRIGAAIYVFINAAGALYAAGMGESMHAATHVVLLMVGAAAYAVWRMNSQPYQQETLAAAQANERIEHMQQALDSIALNVERIGEAQRFETRILEERGEIIPPKKEQ